MDVRRTIYDKFGDVMKKIDGTITGAKKEEEFPGLEDVDSELIDETSDDSDPSNNTEALWDLSELDPEIYEDVFEPVMDTNQSDQSDQSDINVIDAAEIDNDSVVTAPAQNFEKPKNLKTVSISAEDEDDSEDEDEELIKAAEMNEEEPGEMDDLFAEKIEVRPQVAQLLDKHGTVTIDQLKQELLEVYELLSKK